MLFIEAQDAQSVTGQDYTMNCVAGTDDVVCMGGDNAYVEWPAN